MPGAQNTAWGVESVAIRHDKAKLLRDGIG